ncbi:class I SAM-dependent methyltransferase [Streptomyces profundus]|uniref:class I SAM-dependent methyltransferase n=1 Tax=Streptomyces profundus TaxID=2867410 RepID=UPI001D1607BC|nr:class I SAM-dependent methyltransferase [Streptomyces sp. MA3_2.13]UED86034.1 class I SAM-dependent methyltransferase [Streptomyces sp. MA3_2.13]
MSAHAHHHHPPHEAVDFDWDAAGAQLTRGAELHAVALRATARWLRGEQPAARRILDVGSGPGVVTALLADEFPGAEVVAVDGAPELLRLAERRALAAGLAERVRTRQAELPAGLAGIGGGFDLVWASLFVHHLGDQQHALGQLAAALRPGGSLALAEGGLPARFLPRDFGLGRPGLQERLDAAHAEWFQEMRAALPDAVAVPEDWPSMLTGAGLAPVARRTFLTELPAPLPADARAYLRERLSRQREHVGDRLSREDRSTLDALLDPEAASGILRRPDAFYLAASTVHVGRAG